jgi:hypothetical protein
MPRSFDALTLLLVLLVAPAPAAQAKVACDPAAAGEVRSAVASACRCDGFASHTQYLGCTRAAVGAAVKAGSIAASCRASLGRLFRLSTCSFRRPKTTCCEHARNGTKCAIRSAERCAAASSGASPACNFTPFCADADCAGGGLGRAELLYGGEGNRLRRYDIDTIKHPPLVDDILIHSASDDPPGRDINAQICVFPDGSGRFIAGEDTDQPHPPAGWGVFAPDGTQIGKLTPTYQPAADQPENFGCVFDHQGRLFLTDIGNEASGAGTGQLILFFPPYDRFPGAPGVFPNTDEPSTNFCIIATNIATAGSLAVDEQGRIYVTSARGLNVQRFSPPFPTSPDAAGGCGAVDPVGSPMADIVHRETFVGDAGHILTPTGIARARNGNWYIGAVFSGTIGEYTPDGTFVRLVLEPPVGEPLPTVSTGNPQGLAVDCAGDLYFADLNLVQSDGNIGPGPNGKVRWIHFDAAGTPAPPVILKQNLDFPDALGILPGDLQGGP